MSEPAPEVRCRCSACRVDAAELLLRTRRPGMALRLLQDVPMQLTEALGTAYARGHDNAVLGQASGPPLGDGNVVPLPTVAPDRVRRPA